MLFDLHTVPFSRFGSYFAFSILPERPDREAGLYLRLVRGGDNDIGAVFRIELLAGGQAVPFTCSASSTLLRLEAEEGTVEWCIPEPDFIRVRSQGVGVRLTCAPGVYDYAFPLGERGWEFNSFVRERRFLLSPVAGSIREDVRWDGVKAQRLAFDGVPGGDGKLELTLEEYRTVPRPLRPGSFEQGLAQVRSEYAAWRSRMPAVAALWSEAEELAAYITWSCVVQADGYLPRSAMYMSKNWMTNIWSWDHCFNAMALAAADPDLAWDQFAIFFDRQDDSGMLPDFMNDKYALWNCCKPPIHGWTLRWLMNRSEAVTPERLAEIYEPLARWTQWWFDYRDDDRDGVPQYNHGNDSGWDNSTVFLAAIPVESPDLCAFLILQMEVLATVAAKLGCAGEAEQWERRSQELLMRMIEHFWRGDRFQAVQSGTHAGAVEGDSLMAYLPVVLGKRLPEPILRKLVEGLREEGRFLTAHGFATESIRSPLYAPDGYWRGPIWAPVMLLLVEGLKEAGEEQFAADVARRFCRMAASAGMAENFDALEGHGLRDRAFTWTSSVFLLLAREYGA
ncbi:amylo-alpha-1,6-glucosidase [Paenibacillus elgii]|uniref:amylo-alpha-1,6-glucosidase n=1 Tax=Paenibacillus elgii TaxID=189691 RepID=UPI0030D86CEE